MSFNGLLAHIITPIRQLSPIFPDSFPNLSRLFRYVPLPSALRSTHSEASSISHGETKQRQRRKDNDYQKNQFCFSCCDSDVHFDRWAEQSVQRQSSRRFCSEFGRLVECRGRPG